ncbi:hypothetical protein HZA87_00375 [Candidatus Uhrbacteria bacterium]|nr:hypothetical protein [Candidatus Uhrbacteria bacterium]
MFALTKEEMSILGPLKTPKRIQDFLDALSLNFEKHGDTCLSPRVVLRERHAHCIEGAMLAALALRLHGARPLLMDLASAHGDQDHVVALFQESGRWGAISKTNHAVLRYRDPVYATVRELALSYFHEYFLDDGKKTLRSFSAPVDLSRFDSRGWMTDEKDLWYIVHALDDAPHTQILLPGQAHRLRKADKIEIEAGELMEWKKSMRKR